MVVAVGEFFSVGRRGDVAAPPSNAPATTQPPDPLHPTHRRHILPLGDVGKGEGKGAHAREVSTPGRGRRKGGQEQGWWWREEGLLGDAGWTRATEGPLEPFLGLVSPCLTTTRHLRTHRGHQTVFVLFYHGSVPLVGRELG